MAVETATSVLEEFAGRREDLIPILQRVQDVEGHLSAESIRLISRKLRVSENEIHGVATFYAQFRFHPPGKHHIHACMGTACHVRGGQQLLNTLEHRLGIKDGETTPDRLRIGSTI
jgi:NADH-quinone oxidoreductase subunit E